MTLDISFHPDTHLFYLSNGSMSYIMELVEGKYLAHCYWGRALKHYNKAKQVPMSKKTFAASPYLEKAEFSLEILPLEFPHSYQGDYKQAAISVSQENGQDMLRLEYKDFQIIDDLPNIPDLPQARKFAEDKARTLAITLVDSVAGVEVTLFYSIFEKNAALIRSSKVTNIGKGKITVNQLASASVDMNYNHQILTTMYGSHQEEFQLQQQEIMHGQFKTGTSRGASGPQYSPFMAISHEASEFSGDVHSLTLIYSGNHTELIERDQYDQLRFQIGLNSENFAWTLGAGESFYSPQAVMVYSPNGFNGMSQEFHNFTENHLINPVFRDQLAPILINSWEMTYFDVEESKMLSLIDQAADLGFEAVVLDDGWFLGRNNSKTSLGDWVVDEEKFPNDLFPLVNRAHHHGLKFGIWFEPEMISPTSLLYSQHPDWVLKSNSYDALYGRSQFVLDLSKKEVQDFILSTLSHFIEKYEIDYIKWDMNRHLTEPFCQSGGQQHPKAVSHQYILGLYRIIDTLVKTYPELLFENCSSGGGRMDYGMLYYFPQTWASDNTDGLDRQFIQYGASYLFHPYQMTGHVSITPNHQTQRETSLETRMNLASSTNMGYELDILNFSEQEIKQTQRHIAVYKQDRKLIQSANFYRLSSPFTSNYCAWLFESKEKESYLMMAFCNRYSVSKRHHVMKIPYLNPDKVYHILELDLTVSGSELAYSGLHLPFENLDWASLVLHIKER